MTVQPVYEEATSGLPSSGERLTDEASRHLRTKFLRRLAHDIASPAGVTMTVLDELSSSARPELVLMARRGIRRLLRLSEQLALVAELESGDFIPETVPDDLGKLLGQAVDLAVGIDGRRDVTVSSAATTAKIVVNVDHRVVLAVLREVVGNALRLASSKVLVETVVADASRHVTIRVHDDGPGFAPEVIPTIGERFTARSGVRGLGLSLSMAKEILAAHEGELHLETSALPPGRRGTPGAAVAIVLPIE